jgi:hypothetical protein
LQAEWVRVVVHPSLMLPVLSVRPAMTETTKRVFMFFGEAVSGDDQCGCPKGEWHKLAGFGRGTELEEAAEAAAQYFRDAGWKHVAFEKGDELLGAQLVNADEDIRRMVEAARRDGAAGLVFKNEVPQG